MKYDPDALDALTWLQVWFSAQCDGDWEHQMGIDIETLDNPGWTLKIQVAGTEVGDQAFDKEETYRSEDDWSVVWVEAGFFQAACGPTNLGEVIHRFRMWTESSA